MSESEMQYSEIELETCPCRKTCCENPKVNYENGYSECHNCHVGCYCND